MRFLFSALTIGLLLAVPVAAGDDGLTGYWKFSIYRDGQQEALWLLNLDSKDGKLTITGESLKGAPKVKVGDIKLVGDTLTMKFHATVVSQEGPQEISLDYEGKLPKPGAKKIFGSIILGGGTLPAVFEATTAKSVFDLDRDAVTRTPNDPRAHIAVLDLIRGAKENKVSAKDLQEWVDGSLKSVEAYGPRYQLKQQMRLLQTLQGQDSYKAVALETARRISKQIDPKAPLDTQSQILSAVIGALRAGDAKDEAKTLEVRIEKLEGTAYAEYAKDALNFKTAKFAGRKIKSNRAVLVELFTGAQCPPCVAADMAFDGVEKTYGPGDVVLLQYHMNIPSPEPMSNPDSDARMEFYADIYPKKVRGTPTALFNGKPDVAGGGSRDEAPEVYKDYCAWIDKLLETPASVKLSASATLKSDKIDIVANVKDLDKPGNKMRLRIALVEDWVRYKGGNRLQYHHRVVRALPGGAKGVALKEKEFDQKVSVDLDQLRKSLSKYLDDDYPEGPRPLRLRNLHVVAFVQNDETSEVLQAVDVKVKEE